MASIAAVVVIVLALIFHRLKLKVKKGDLEVSLHGSKSPESPSTPPHLGTQNTVAGKQTNIGGDQYNAQRDITHAEGDVVQVGGRALDVNEDRFTMEDAVVSEDLNDIVAEGTGVIVSFDYRVRQKTLLPAGVRQAILDMNLGETET